MWNRARAMLMPMEDMEIPSAHTHLLAGALFLLAYVIFSCCTQGSLRRLLNGRGATHVQSLLFRASLSLAILGVMQMNPQMFFVAIACLIVLGAVLNMLAIFLASTYDPTTYSDFFQGIGKQEEAAQRTILADFTKVFQNGVPSADKAWRRVGAKSTKFVAKSRYEDLSASLEDSFFVFLAQCLLVGYFTCHLYSTCISGDILDNWTHIIYYYSGIWLLPMLNLTISSPFRPWSFWLPLLAKAKEATDVTTFRVGEKKEVDMQLLRDDVLVSRVTDQLLKIEYDLRQLQRYVSKEVQSKFEARDYNFFGVQTEVEFKSITTYMENSKLFFERVRTMNQSMLDLQQSIPRGADSGGVTSDILVHANEIKANMQKFKSEVDEAIRGSTPSLSADAPELPHHKVNEIIRKAAGTGNEAADTIYSTIDFRFVLKSGCCTHSSGKYEQIFCKQLGKGEVWQRMMLYLLANNVLYELIKLLLPLTLALSDTGIDFVVSSVALLIVLHLDDLLVEKELAVTEFGDGSQKVEFIPASGRESYQPLPESSEEK